MNRMIRVQQLVYVPIIWGGCTMKRILHAISQYPGKTGSGTYLQAIVKEAYKKGYEQSVIAGVPKDHNDVEFGDISNIKFYPVIFETEKLPFPIAGMSDIMPYKSTKYSDMDEEMFLKWEKAFREEINLAINEFKPDIIISHHLWLLTSLIKKIVSDIPVISISHGTDLRQLEMVDKFREYVIEGCKNIEIAMALNDYEKKKIVENYSISIDKVVVIGGGYDSDIFYPCSREKSMDKIKLIYAGKLSFSKGVPSLIRAYEKLFKDNNNIELLIAGSGSGSEEKEIRQLVKEAKGNIKLLGEVPHENLGDIFRECDIFVLPSFYEGLSLVTIEALSCGLSVTASELAGLKNYLGNEINTSGIIGYVKLPDMLDIDTPNKADLPYFEERLAYGIKKQIDKLDHKYNQPDSIYKIIENFSWYRIFEKIEKEIVRLCH